MLNYARERARLFERSRYVDSYGTELPIDLMLFESGMEREHDCALCGDLHNHIILYRFDALRETRVATKAFQCNECYVFVKQMMMVNYPDLLEEEIYGHETSHITRPDYEIKMRINSYNTTRSFAHDVHRYYTHLNIGEDLYANECIGKCYFCGTLPHTKALQVRVPVSGENLQLDGGSVLSCRGCEYELYTSDDNESLMLLDQRCPACFKFYLVTGQELKARSASNTIGKHMCPSCTYDSIANYEENDGGLLYYQENNEIPRIKPPDRYLNKQCSNCEETFIIDLTIMPEILIKKHVMMVKGGAKKVYCNKCVELHTFKSNDNKVWIEFNKDVYIVIYKQGKQWLYKIWKTNITDKPTLIFESAKEVSTNPIETTFVAWDECKKLFNYQQKELWEDQS